MELQKHFFKILKKQLSIPAYSHENNQKLLLLLLILKQKHYFTLEKCNFNEKRYLNICTISNDN
jgi:hypothetical protein